LKGEALDHDREDERGRAQVQDHEGRIRLESLDELAMSAFGR
jgi:hypothetical protein